jgi:hypothetical protein
MPERMENRVESSAKTSSKRAAYFLVDLEERPCHLKHASVVERVVWIWTCRSRG